MKYIGAVAVGVFCILLFPVVLFAFLAGWPVLLAGYIADKQYQEGSLESIGKNISLFVLIVLQFIIFKYIFYIIGLYS